MPSVTTTAPVHSALKDPGGEECGEKVVPFQCGIVKTVCIEQTRE